MFFPTSMTSLMATLIIIIILIWQFNENNLQNEVWQNRQSVSGCVLGKVGIVAYTNFSAR
jgi:hypothetical protein